MGSISEFKNPAGVTTLVVFKPNVERITKLTITGLCNYELKIHGVGFGVIKGPTEVKFYNLFHRLYILLSRFRDKGSIFSSTELTDQFTVLAMVNNLDLTTGRTWNEYDIYLPEWNSLDMSNIPEGFQFVAIGDCHRVHKPRISVNYL